MPSDQTAIQPAARSGAQPARIRDKVLRYVSDSLLRLAKRELHDVLRSRLIWMGCLAAGCLMELAGPFGTGEVMRLLLRLVHWVFLASLAFLTGSALSALVRDRAARTTLPVWVVSPSPRCWPVWRS